MKQKQHKGEWRSVTRLLARPVRQVVAPEPLAVTGCSGKRQGWHPCPPLASSTGGGAALGHLSLCKQKYSGLNFCGFCSTHEDAAPWPREKPLHASPLFVPEWYKGLLQESLLVFGLLAGFLLNICERSPMSHLPHFLLGPIREASVVSYSFGPYRLQALL